MRRRFPIRGGASTGLGRRLRDTAGGPIPNNPLAMIDEPRNLVSRGRGNLFSQIGTYLISAGKDQQRAPITNFATWEQDATEPREVGSRLTGASVWDAADPLKALSQERDNPSRVFLLNSRFAATGDFGARQGHSVRSSRM